MALLKACSQAYILMTLIPVITSFMIRTLLSVSLADFNLMCEIKAIKKISHAINKKDSVIIK